MRSSPKIKVNPLATTNSSAANVSPLSSWNRFMGCNRAPPSFARGADIPIENLLPGPEQHIGLAADRLDHFAEIPDPVRRPHDVGMEHQRHHARRFGRVGVDLLELIERAVAIFRRLVMLDQ